MTEIQATILITLVGMDKFRNERVLTLSVFRMKFSQYLEGQTRGMEEKEVLAFKKWDSLREEERTQVAIEFLKRRLVVSFNDEDGY